MFNILLLIYAVVAGFLYSFTMLYLSSLIYFLFKHPVGLISYAFKTISILLIAIPVAILLLLILSINFLKSCWIISSVFFKNIAFFNRKNNKILSLDEGVCAQESSQCAATSNDVVITLIHGTFEPNASWTKSNSKIRNAIERQIPSAYFKRFVWSGLNRHAARVEASENLIKEISKSNSDNHYLIAHSHAGNILTDMSTRDPSVCKKIKGVYFLSTPFILRSQILRTGDILVHITSLILPLLMSLIISTIVWWYEIVDWKIGFFAFALFLVLDVILSRRYSDQLKKELSFEEKNKEGRADILKSAKIISALGDEADTSLRIVGMLHEACLNLLSQLADAGRLEKQNIKLQYYIYAIINIVIAGYIAYEYDFFSYQFIIALMGTAIGCLFYLWAKNKPSKEISNRLAFAALPASIGAFFIAVAKCLSYGDWRLLFVPNIFVFSSETPAGSHQITKIIPNSDGDLYHSSHSNQQVIDQIVIWLDASIMQCNKVGCNDDCIIK